MNLQRWAKGRGKTLKGNMRQAQQGKVWDLEYAAVLCSLCKQRLGMEMGESQAPL